MTETLSKIESNKATAINPQYRRAIAFLVGKFDSVQKMQKGSKFKFNQVYPDLPEVREDGRIFVKMVQ